MKILLLADEAIAQGALDGGLSAVYAYPGTPSTEITEDIQKTNKEIHSRWSTNEKTAMEEAVGMSFVGKRSMVCMKHLCQTQVFVRKAIMKVFTSHHHGKSEKIPNFRAIIISTIDCRHLPHKLYDSA